ncbi:MAG: antitoxin [Casimicrobiaceae bacterium]
MRTTIDLPEDLHRIASGLARHTGRSLSGVVVELMQRGLVIAAEPGPAPYALDPQTGLPVVRSPRPVTDDDVRALDDET